MNSLAPITTTTAAAAAATTDLVWRAPVPLQHSRATAAESSQHDERVRPWLSVLLVSCHVLRLDMETTFAAACLLHRYYLLQPDDKNNNKWLIVCVIFVACKTQEDHRRLRDFINLAYMITWQQEELNNEIKSTSNDKETNKTISSDTTTTSNQILQLTWNKDPPPLDDKYWKDKELIVQAEQTVLRCLAFDVHVSHPHRLVVLLMQECCVLQQSPNDKDDQSSLNKAQQLQESLVQETWTLLNSCVFCVTALQQPALVLTVAALDIVVIQNNNKNNSKLDDQHAIPGDWWKDTGVTAEAKQTATKILLENVQKQATTVGKQVTS